MFFKRYYSHLQMFTIRHNLKKKIDKTVICFGLHTELYTFNQKHNTTKIEINDI